MGRLGSEASMLAHAASHGVIWQPEIRLPERPPSSVTWRAVVWKQWNRAVMYSRTGNTKARGAA